MIEVVVDRAVQPIAHLCLRHLCRRRARVCGLQHGIDEPQLTFSVIPGKAGIEAKRIPAPEIGRNLRQACAAFEPSPSTRLT
jgi:hypothetical protein